MKALTIKQPWADAIVHGEKRTENRTWLAPSRYIGTRILIHAGLTGDRRAALSGVRPGPDVRGAILGVATLASCHFDGDGCSENCATWGQRDVFHWQLVDVAALVAPVPAKGKLGFWTPTPDAIAAIEAVQAEVAW